MTYPLSKDTDITVLKHDDKCDKYDYLIATACGIVSGMVDIFLVGAPGDSVIGAWTDNQVDNCVMAFAKRNGWSPRAGKEGNVNSAIAHLENHFKVNYDHRHGGDVDHLFKMSTKNHHMKSLAHSPSPVGLFFSILNQFTSTASFMSNGQLITIKTETFELQGGNFVSKLFCGVANWFGHLMSDVAGSSGATTRGSGIVMPFYELFGLCNFGSFKVDGSKESLAQIATRAFESGYDARFGLAMAVPVVLCDLSIRLIWGIRRFFQYKLPLKECIPTSSHADLRVMLLVGNGALCLIDGVDALIRGGGNPVLVFTRLNLVGWCRLATLALKEVFIRVGISIDLQNDIDAYIRINEALQFYLSELEKIDIDAYERETKECERLAGIISAASTNDELNKALHQVTAEMGLTVPWESHGSLDAFMKDKKAVLRFD